MSIIITDKGKVNINGKDISIINGVITVDGKVVDSDIIPKDNVTIICDGDLISVNATGSVTCKNVHGNVVAGGSVHVACNIEGSINAGGSVNVKGHLISKSKLPRVSPPKTPNPPKSLVDTLKRWW
jgi:hypothetical protein